MKNTENFLNICLTISLPKYSVAVLIQQIVIDRVSFVFFFKVSIPGLATQYQPPKLCRTVDEAKSYAAEYTLQQLGVPIEGMSR